MRAKPFTVEFLGTPEAGKTTVINQICRESTNRDKITYVRESAEITPNYFAKGSMQAHFWMRLTTAKKLLEKNFSSSADSIILVDRGIVDSIFLITTMERGIYFLLKKFLMQTSFLRILI
jgi:GTPase SAR1 family protein